MKTIIEFTPTSRTHYAMPDETYSIIERALDLRIVKGVSRAVNLMPPELRAEIKITVLSDKTNGIRGRMVDAVLIEEFAKRK